MGAFSVTANGPGTLAMVSLATRRVPGRSCWSECWTVPSVTIRVIQPGTDGPLWIDFILGVLSAIAMLACGMYIGSRRELLWTLRDRAERAEAEQGLRVEQARTHERARIAREMHDVLAHRISLIAVHAGALAYRTDLSDAEKTADRGAHPGDLARGDRRPPAGPRRAPRRPTRGPHERPQPTFGDLSTLVREAEGAGMRIQSSTGWPGPPRCRTRSAGRRTGSSRRG